MTAKHHLILLLLVTFTLYSSAQDFVDIRPYGESSCLEFMTQAYRGNIIAVETESGIPYKVKLNKIKQIEWVIQDSSASMYSMLNTGDLIGAYTTSANQTAIICRDRFANEKWKITLNPTGYYYTFLELNDDEFLIAGGTWHKSFVAKMNLAGEILWTTKLDKSIHLLVTSEELMFKANGGYIISTLDYRTSELVFVKLDLEGNILWEKATPFGNGEGGIEILQKKDGNFLVYEPSPEDIPYYDQNKYHILEYDKELNLISRDAFQFFPCSNDFQLYTPYLQSMHHHEDEILYTGIIRDLDTTKVFLFFRDKDNCWEEPMILPNPNLYKCPLSYLALDRIIKQRGQSFVFAFDYRDAQNYFPRISNTDISAFGPSYPELTNVRVYTSSDHCQDGMTTTFTDNWMITRGSIQASLPPEGSLDMFSSIFPGSFRINSNTFGYDHCILENEDSDSVKITVFPSEESGLGILGAFTKNSTTPQLNIKYWSHGRDKVTEGKVTLTSNTPLSFSDDRILQIDDNGKIWQITITNLEAFNWYLDTLNFLVDDVSASDSLQIKLNISSNEVPGVQNYLSTRILSYNLDQDRFGVQSYSGSEYEVRNDERILFYLSHTNTTNDTITDLQFLCDIEDFNTSSGMLEITSHPVKARRAAGPRVGLYSMDFQFSDIKLAPEETAYLYYSINPGNKSCGSILKNQVTTVVDYQHQDTVAIPITLIKQTMIKVDTQLTSGSNFKGHIINFDTILTIQNMATQCDTIFTYNISVTTTASSDLSHYGIKIGPNPFRNYIEVFDPKNQISSVRVMDISGNEVSHQYFSNTVSIEKVTPGVYLLDISLKDGSRIRQKILKM